MKTKYQFLDKKNFFLLIITCFLYAIGISGKTDHLYQKITPNFQEQLNQLLNHQISDAYLGFLVMNAATGQIIYENNGFQYFKPASVTKLFTAYGALSLLTPLYTYKTTLAIDTEKKTEKSVKNVYIRFSGDPSFTVNDLQLLIHELKTHGIEHIKNDIILDTSCFNGALYPQGLTVDDQPWAYGAPVHPIIIDQNRLSVLIKPSTKLNDTVKITLNNQYKDYFQIHNSVKTVSYEDALNSCEFSVSMKQSSLHFSGCWPVGQQQYKALAIIDPVYFAIKKIKDILKKEKIILHGTIKTGLSAKKKNIIATHKSKPMADLVSHMLKFSNNVYAGSLLKTINKNKKYDSTLGGIKEIKALLTRKTDIDIKKMSFFDGAGLSNYNLFSPYQISQLLYSIYHAKIPLKNNFLNALPQPAKTGTLLRRMKTFGLYDNIKAKTGTMSGVSALAGYMTTEKNQNVVFVLMINNDLGAASNRRIFEDQLLAILRSTPFMLF